MEISNGMATYQVVNSKNILGRGSFSEVLEGIDIESKGATHTFTFALLPIVDEDSDACSEDEVDELEVQ